MRKTLFASPIWGLALFHAKALITNPVIWLGVIGSTALGLSLTAGEFGVLDRASVLLAWALVPLAVATAIVTGVGVLRIVGREHFEISGASPVALSEQVLAVVAATGVPALLGVVVQLGLSGWLATRTPAGQIVWMELAQGPALILTSGGAVAAATRWFPNPASISITVIVMGALTVANAGPSFAGYEVSQWGLENGVEWLLPFGPLQDDLHYSLAFRPAGTHLAFLLAAFISFTSVAAAKGRLRYIGTPIALVACAAIGLSQLGSTTEEARLAELANLVGETSRHRCERQASVEYCAIESYGVWVDTWASLVGPIVEAAPSGSSLQVRQYPARLVRFAQGSANSPLWYSQHMARDFEARSATIPIEDRWDTGSSPRILATRVARYLVGCGDHCGDEGPQVLVTWLALHAPDIEAELRRAASVEGFVALCLAIDLFDQVEADEDIVAMRSKLLEPSISYTEIGNSFGLHVPRAVSPSGWLGHDTPCP